VDSRVRVGAVGEGTSLEEESDKMHQIDEAGLEGTGHGPSTSVDPCSTKVASGAPPPLHLQFVLVAWS